MEARGRLPTPSPSPAPVRPLASGRTSRSRNGVLTRQHPSDLKNPGQRLPDLIVRSRGARRDPELEASPRKPVAGDHLRRVYWLYTSSALDGFFPGPGELAEHGTCFAWEHQPCIGAAFAPYDPPFAEHPELASPEGRIHFAGEHASGERGVGMQGALESGLRAASEVDPEVTGESAGAAVAISPSRGVRRFAADLCVPGWLAV